MALASSTEETSRDLARMETMMQEDEHHGDRWFKEAVQQAKVAETIQAMAPAAVFFASSDSKWITGERLLIAGGLR